MTARDRIVIMVVLAVGAVVAAWFLVVSPKRSQASSLNTQITSEQSQLSAAQQQVAAGVSARKTFAGQYAELAKLGEAVPPDDDIPSLIYQVQSAAQSSHVSFRGLQLTGGGSSSSSTPSTSSSSGGSSSSTAATPQLPPGASVGAAGLPTEQFTITLTGNYFNLSTFFNKLEGFVVMNKGTLTIRGRLMSINAITLTPGPTGFPQISATVSATTYIVPPTEGPFGGATPAGPAPTTTQASTSGSSSSSSSSAPAAAITSVLR
ncbi:MAG TPA: hypothetical protein VMJ65_14340 [Solirubrobacteraceae bacterium]|nr:hypothetical protein [Solirubrobacteraceae bacterium]